MPNKISDMDTIWFSSRGLGRMDIPATIATTGCMETCNPMSQTLGRRARTPKIREMINKTMKIKKSTLAMPAAATEMPVNPNTAANSAMMKNTAAQYSIITSLVGSAGWADYYTLKRQPDVIALYDRQRFP
jgi:hypothetical protein